MTPTGCSCGGRGCCTMCALEAIEADPLELRMMNTALDATYAALAAPRLAAVSNVVQLDGYSKKARP